MLFEEEFTLSRIQIMASLLALGLAAGCKAQPALPAAPDASINRHIEVTVRSQFNVPADIELTIGTRSPSQFAGYDSLPIILSHGAKKQSIDFLISTDNKTLARLVQFSLVNDPAMSIDLAGRPIRGNPAAKVTVINFDDLECPYCARMHQMLFPATQDRYKDTVRFIYKDNPLYEIHPWAMRAAVDANCLAAQSGEVYWAYVDYLHSHGQEVTGPDRNTEKSFAALDRIARQQATVGKLDSAALDGCIAKQDETAVRASLKEAEALSVDGAPTLFVEGERISGALPQALVWGAIDRALRAAGIEPPAVPAPQAAATGAQPPPAAAGK
jgi:protein-disulfide isomerase